MFYIYFKENNNTRIPFPWGYQYDGYTSSVLYVFKLEENFPSVVPYSKPLFLESDNKMSYGCKARFINRKLEWYYPASNCQFNI